MQLLKNLQLLAQEKLENMKKQGNKKEVLKFQKILKILQLPIEEFCMLKAETAINVLYDILEDKQLAKSTYLKILSID